VTRLPLAYAIVLLAADPAGAQEPECRVLCSPELKIEPTVSISPLFGAPRIVEEDGAQAREERGADLEIILSLGVPTRIPWLELTVESIFLPFDEGSTPELEFEANLIWLPSERTGGWVSSHFDVVDKFSSAERPSDRRAYTHKLNLELDTSFSLFHWLPEGRWLRSVELEGSLDYVATGLPKAGDVIDGALYLDDASPWSFSIVFVFPVAPL
jgi:hypothetical protein